MLILSELYTSGSSVNNNNILFIFFGIYGEDVQKLYFVTEIKKISVRLKGFLLKLILCVK
jgi:hypothetical protein